MNLFKQQLITSCKDHLTQKVNDLMKALQDVTEAGNSETKSTVGDKHETARAMMQLEQEKLSGQLQEAEKQLAEFEKIDFNKNVGSVALGGLIETNKGLFFIATSIGKIIVDNRTVFVISNKSPLGTSLLSKKQKDTVLFNSVSYIVESIY